MGDFKRYVAVDFNRFDLHFIIWMCIYMYVYIYILFYKRFLCRPSVAARKVNETEGTNDSVRQCLQA